MNLFDVKTAKAFNNFLERLRAAQNPQEHGTANPVFCVYTRKPKHVMQRSFGLYLQPYSL